MRFRHRKGVRPVLSSSTTLDSEAEGVHGEHRVVSVGRNQFWPVGVRA
jgi:hypothetical protein